VLVHRRVPVQFTSIRSMLFIRELLRPLKTKRQKLYFKSARATVHADATTPSACSWAATSGCSGWMRTRGGWRKGRGDEGRGGGKAAAALHTCWRLKQRTRANARSLRPHSQPFAHLPKARRLPLTRTSLSEWCAGSCFLAPTPCPQRA
jgi:hypothetical protein